MKFGTGQSWESQSTPQMKMQAAKQFANPPPAIVQAAHTFEFYMKAIETCDLMHDQERSRLIKQLKESGTWKDKYDSWEAVSELVLGMTARHSNRLIASVSGDSGHACPESTDKTTRAELKALKQVEKSRETPEEEDGEDEKPAVRAATPEQMKRVEPQGPRSEVGPTGKPSENGKPKSQLAIWTHVHDSYGALLRDVDRLHNLAPKESLHNELLTLTKRAMECIRKWQSEV